MKNFGVSFLVIIVVVSFANAQIGDNSLPTSFLDKPAANFLNEDRTIELNSPSIENLLEEDRMSTIPGVPNRVGINVPSDISMMDEGSWTNFPNGDKICRLVIHMKHAKALGLYFQEGVYIPEGATLHIFDVEGKKNLGAFTSENDGFKALEMIPGEKLILEYYEPKNTVANAVVKIKQVVFFYKSLLFDEKVLDCQVDVSCPEGQFWSDQRRSVVMYTYPEGMATGTCTAVMVNNIAQDCTPYLLSASHCGFIGAGDDISNWVWYWNYEKNSCQPGAGNQNALPLSSNTLTGGMVRGSSLDGALDNGMGVPEIQGTDVVLIELNEKPPVGFNAYLAGWSKTTAIPLSGVSIHHPGGSEKKIATTNQIFSGSSNLFWCVQWMETNNGFGMLEPGSSGCPLFDQDKRVVGVASFSFPEPCSINQTDCFGRISSSGSSASANLAFWLDPDNTGLSFVDGRENFCSTADAPIVQMKELKLYPNPAKENVFISNSNWKHITITDIYGHVVRRFCYDFSDRIPLIGLATGYYVVNVEMNDGYKESFQLIKQ